MPLQNRVTPFGEIVATPERGTMFGNRGGRFHDPRTLSLKRRRFASRRWICCELSFKSRRRKVFGDGYTELFFLDEATALAAGHRPCFECRRKDAEGFAAAWQRAFKLLRPARADGRAKRLHRRKIDGLPDGAFVMLEEGAWAVRGDALLRWTPEGYDKRKPR